MTDTERERILALLEGKPLEGVCQACPPHPLMRKHELCGCRVCNGTGRINTEPTGPVEEGVATLRHAYLRWIEDNHRVVALLKVAEAERDEALARAERAEAALRDPLVIHFAAGTVHPMADAERCGVCNGK